MEVVGDGLGKCKLGVAGGVGKHGRLLITSSGAFAPSPCTPNVTLGAPIIPAREKCVQER